MSFRLPRSRNPIDAPSSKLRERNVATACKCAPSPKCKSEYFFKKIVLEIGARGEATTRQKIFKSRGGIIPLILRSRHRGSPGSTRESCSRSRILLEPSRTAPRVPRAGPLQLSGTRVASMTYRACTVFTRLRRRRNSAGSRRAAAPWGARRAAEYQQSGGPLCSLRSPAAVTSTSSALHRECLAFALSRALLPASSFSSR